MNDDDEKDSSLESIKEEEKEMFPNDEDTEGMMLFCREDSFNPDINAFINNEDNASPYVRPKAPRRINLNALSDPLLPPTKKTPMMVQDEFFGVYCLISRSELKQYKVRPRDQTQLSIIFE